jgi:hypothetical protein
VGSPFGEPGPVRARGIEKRRPRLIAVFAGRQWRGVAVQIEKVLGGHGQEAAPAPDRCVRRRNQDTENMKGKYPPPPDMQFVFRRAHQETVEYLYSRTRIYRAIIARDEKGVYRVYRERWDVGDWEVAGAAFWCQDEPRATFADTIETARTLAREVLAITPDGLEPQGEQ